MNRLIVLLCLLLFPLIVCATEGFETGDFSAYHWQFAGVQPWTVQSSVVYAGSYAARSGVIGSSCSSSLVLTLNILEAGNISFRVKVSSAMGDYLSFRMDGLNRQSWYGEVNWVEYSYALTPGVHSFEWRYGKNDSVVQGSDCAWLDEIVFPACEPVFPPMAELNPTSLNLSLNQGYTTTASFNISNIGQQTLTYSVQLPPENEVHLSESFEYDVPPAGWSHQFAQIQVWRKTPGWDGHPPAAYDGNYNAGLFCSNNYVPAIDRLISPVMDLSGVDQAKLSFYHFQYVSGRPTELKVLYRSNSGQDWSLLASYTGHAPNWTLRTLDLPNLSESYQIAFEGSTYNGFGIHIDYVSVFTPIFVQPEWLQPAPYSSGSIQPGGVAQIAGVDLDSSGLETGVYEAEVRIVQNNMQQPYVILPVTLTVLCYPEIAISADSLDFGLVEVGSVDTLSFTISNPGADTLIAEINIPECFGLYAEGASEDSRKDRNTLELNLEPGASEVLNLSFAPTQMQDYSFDLVISHNAPQPEGRIMINAQGAKAILAASADSIHISEAIGQDGVFDLQIANLGNLPLTYSLTIEANPHWLKIGDGWEQSGTIQPESDSLTIQLQYSQEFLVPGVHYCNLLIETNDPELSSLIIPLEFEIINHPHSLDLPDYLSFYDGEELEIELDPYIIDQDQQQYWFMVQPYPENIQIGGYDTLLRLYTWGNWIGEEVIHVVVMDYYGEIATDSIQVAVLDVPDELQSPVLAISRETDGVRISWDAIPAAQYYEIYGATEVDGDYQLLGASSVLYWDQVQIQPQYFFKVKAMREDPRVLVPVSNERDKNH